MKLEDTIEVIGKLTKSEKRSISITLTRMSKSDDPTEQHYRLYNLLSSIVKDSEKPKNFEGNGQEKIASQKKYIDDRINEEKDKESKLFTSLNVIRLYEFIFSTLRSLNADRPTFKLSNYLQDIQILRDKGLPGQAMRLIAKAKKEAQEDATVDGNLQHLHFIFLERNTHLTITNSRNYEALAELNKESKLQYKQIRYTLDALDDQELINRYISAGEKVPEKVIEKVSNTFKLILEKPEAAKDLPLDAALAVLFTTTLYLRALGASHERVLLQLNQMNALFDKDKISRHPKLYHKTKMALINDGLKNGITELVEKNIHYLLKIIGLEPESPIEDQVEKIVIDKHTTRDYFNNVFIVITYTIGIKNFDASSKIISHIKDLIEEYQPPQGFLPAFYWEFATVHFLRREFESAKEYVDEILELEEARKDVVFEAELLNLLVEYEIGLENGQSSSIHEKAGASLTALSSLKESTQGKSYDQGKIESATLLVSNILHNTISGKEFSIAQLQDLYKIQTKGMGDFITDVFALWTQQKIQSLS